MYFYRNQFDGYSLRYVACLEDFPIIKATLFLTAINAFPISYGKISGEIIFLPRVLLITQSLSDSLRTTARNALASATISMHQLYNSVTELSIIILMGITMIRLIRIICGIQVFCPYNMPLPLRVIVYDHLPFCFG